ncbi:MAG: hypothetical protein LLG20_18830 [Acidobacteriales bacterium]|nr:hypothetical protein [Terriglobales bacterium]
MTLAAELEAIEDRIADLERPYRVAPVGSVDWAAFCRGNAAGFCEYIGLRRQVARLSREGRA